MKKKIISLILITFILLCSFPISSFADEIDTTANAGRYYWIGQFSVRRGFLTANDRIQRYISSTNELNYLVIKGQYVNDGIPFVLIFSNPYNNINDFNTFKNNNVFLVNEISNGNLGSISTQDTLTSISIHYLNNTGITNTEYVGYTAMGIGGWFYQNVLRSGTYFYVEISDNYYFNNNNHNDTLSFYKDMITYYLHGVLDNFVTSDSNHTINNTFNLIQQNRYYPFVFGRNNTNGDQRTYDDQNTNIHTINIHPEDVWNTYEVNRNTNSVTVDFDNYILPNAINNNGTVISDSDLRYQDFTFNTEYEIGNVNNYYQSDNNSGDNGGNGSINNSGVTITVSEGALQQQQQQYQTIEENAVNVTVNNNNNLNQDMVNDIDQIINNTSPEQQNTFQTTVQNIAGFTQIGSAFAQLAGTFLSFLPSWVTTLLSITFAIVFFLIVLRIIHLFI